MKACGLSAAKLNIDFLTDKLTAKQSSIKGLQISTDWFIDMPLNV